MSQIMNALVAGHLVAVFTGPVLAQVKIDPNLPDYQAVAGVSGTLKSVGADTMSNEMKEWTAGFARFYPNVQAEIDGKGSSTGPPALIAGTAHFAPMSRPMKSREIDEFKKRFGYPPIALPSSIDMLAVYVHKDNPLKGLTMQQIDAIFSRTRKGGHGKAITTWGELSLDGVWKNRPISLYGRNSASGTYGYFREHALFNGDFRVDVKEQPGSSSVIQGVAGDKFAIGYSGIGYQTADVRAVPVAVDRDADFVEAEPSKAYSGEYPLARFLYVYVNHQPGRVFDPMRREFVRDIFSKQGQADVIRCGYLPVQETTAARVLAAVGIKR